MRLAFRLWMYWMSRLHLRETLTRLGHKQGLNLYLSRVVSEQDSSPVPEFGEIGVKPPPLFEEDASFDRVVDFERDEEVYSYRDSAT